MRKTEGFFSINAPNLMVSIVEPVDSITCWRVRKAYVRALANTSPVTELDFLCRPFWGEEKHQDEACMAEKVSQPLENVWSP